VGNCFLRILETAGNFPTENSPGKANNIRRKFLVRLGEVPLPVNVSCERSTEIPQVIPQETQPIRK